MHFEHPVLVRRVHGFCKIKFCTVLSILLFICPKLKGQHSLSRQLVQSPSAAPRPFVGCAFRKDCKAQGISVLGRGRKYIWTESYIPTLSNQKPLEVAGVAGGTNCLERKACCSFKWIHSELQICNAGTKEQNLLKAWEVLSPLRSSLQKVLQVEKIQLRIKKHEAHGESTA